MFLLFDLENNLGESLEIPSGDALESSYLSLISLSLLLLLLELLGEFKERLSMPFVLVGYLETAAKPGVPTTDDLGRFRILLFLSYLEFLSLLLAIKPS